MKENQMEMEVQQVKPRKKNRLLSIMMALALVLSLSVPCFAAETSAADVLSSSSTITNLISEIFSMITGNWYLTLFLVLSLLGLGVTGLKMLKHAAH